MNNNINEMVNEFLKDFAEDFGVLEDPAITYEVWALGYSIDNEPTDDEVLVGEFTDPDEAIKYAEKTTIEAISEFGFGTPDPNTVYFSVEVETVVADPDDEDGGTINIGTIYRKAINIEPDMENPDPVINLTAADYELTEGGVLRVSRALLKDFNKNDYVYFRFVDDNSSPLISYKIISLTTDGYFECEFEY